MRLVTASQMRALDHQTIHDVGVPGVVLMETAGRAVVEVVASLFPSLPGPGPAVPAGVAGRRVVVVAGPGNNGGDGFVVARCLFDRGAQVEVLLAADEAKVAGDARTHFEAMRRAGVTVHALTTEEQLGEAGRFIDAAEVIVDALLGTGAGRRVEGQLAQVIARINAAPGVRVAVDVPSGIDVDRGHSLGAVVQADHTVSFGFAKLGLVTSPGFLHVGRLVVADIGIAERLARGLGVMCELLDEECLVPLRVKREPRSHKGSFGHLLVVAGSRRHPGAALMTAEAAARTPGFAPSVNLAWAAAWSPPSMAWGRAFISRA